MAKKPKPARKTNLVESLDRIRAAGGHAWDNVKDPVRFIRDMRGGVVKVPKRKPKPATAGEKIVISGLHARQLRWVNLNELHERSRQFAIEISTAKAIDRAIARAVRKERERCVRIVTDYMQEGPEEW